MAATRLHLASYLTGTAACHAMRSRLPASARSGRLADRDPPVHCHDFPEVIWLEAGAMVHVVNGTRQELAAGDVLLIRPNDVHGFIPLPPGGYTMLNVAFTAMTLERLRSMYFPSGPWLWTGGDLPTRRRLDRAGLDRLRGWGQRLTAGPTTVLAADGADRLTFDAFLLDLLRVLRDAEPAVAAAGEPGWLTAAVAGVAADPRLIAEGLPALRRLAGCTGAHLNRSLRRHRGQTAAECVLSLRLDHAARRLRSGDDDVLDIALSCGFTSLGYFYRRFAERFGAPPARWRRREREVVGG